MIATLRIDYFFRSWKAKSRASLGVGSVFDQCAVTPGEVLEMIIVAYRVEPIACVKVDCYTIECSLRP